MLKAAVQTMTMIILPVGKIAVIKVISLVSFRVIPPTLMPHHRGDGFRSDVRGDVN